MRLPTIVCAALLVCTAPALAFTTKEWKTLQFASERASDHSGALAAAYLSCGVNRTAELRSDLRTLLARYLEAESVARGLKMLELEMGRREALECEEKQKKGRASCRERVCQYV